MSNDLNQCAFIGRLGKDPEQRFMGNGDAVCNFTIAVGWKGKDKEGTEWVPCVVYGKLAEICAKYLTKGSQVYVSGKFKTRKWQDKQGVDRYTTEINVDNMQMLGGNGGQSNQAPKQSAGKSGGSYNTGTAFDEESIPF